MTRPERWLAASLLLAACSDTAVLTVGLPGGGASTVLVMPSGVVALERASTSAGSLPAISDAALTGQAVLALDYRAELAALHVPAGALVEDPAGRPLPAYDALYRLRPSADGDAAEWAVAEAEAFDGTRRFAGVGAPPVVCNTLTQAPAVTGTVTFAGDPRFLINVGPDHVWVGLAGQPVRAYAHATGRWSGVELPGGGDVLLAARSEYAYDGVVTIRERGGQPWYESWEVDHGTRLGQVQRAPRYPPVALPPADYRWLAMPLLQPRNVVYALAADGLWIRYDAGASAPQPEVLARWTPTSSTAAVRGGVAVNRLLDVVAVLSDSNTVRWVRRGGTEVHVQALGTSPLVSVDIGGAANNDFVVGAADGAVFLMLDDTDTWTRLGELPDREAMTGAHLFDGDKFLCLGSRGLATMWRFADGSCPPIAIDGAPELLHHVYLDAPSSVLLLGREASGRVGLTRLGIAAF